MIDYKLYDRVMDLEKEIDSMRLLVHNLKQGQQDMLEQIKSLKERLSDGSGK
ncbi:hypothetical protein D3C71_2007140 [compost metagenome]